jgi:hypothetical protein
MIVPSHIKWYTQGKLENGERKRNGKSKMVQGLCEIHTVGSLYVVMIRFGTCSADIYRFLTTTAMKGCTHRE